MDTGLQPDGGAVRLKGSGPRRGGRSGRLIRGTARSSFERAHSWFNPLLRTGVVGVPTFRQFSAHMGSARPDDDIGQAGRTLPAADWQRRAYHLISVEVYLLPAARFAMRSRVNWRLRPMSASTFLEGL